MNYPFPAPSPGPTPPPAKKERRGSRQFLHPAARRVSEAKSGRLNLQLEAQVRERTVALETAHQELQALCQSAWHDLRAPLRHISGFARCLEMEAGPRLEP